MSRGAADPRPPDAADPGAATATTIVASDAAGKGDGVAPSPCHRAPLIRLSATRSVTPPTTTGIMASSRSPAFASNTSRNFRR